jgi:hypothetical protein
VARDAHLVVVSVERRRGVIHAIGRHASSAAAPRRVGSGSGSVSGQGRWLKGPRAAGFPIRVGFPSPLINRDTCTVGLQTCTTGAKEKIPKLIRLHRSFPGQAAWTSTPNHHQRGRELST